MPQAPAKFDSKDITPIESGVPQKFDISQIQPLEPREKTLMDRYNAATEPYTRIEPHQMPHSMSELGREVVKGVGNIGGAALGVVLHPIDTAQGVAEFALRNSPPGLIADRMRGKQSPGEELARQLIDRPLETVESMIGQAGVTEGLGEVTGPMTRGLKKLAGRTAESVSGTSPAVTKEVVKVKQAGNAAADAKTQAATVADDAFSKAQAAIETARENAWKEGNTKYSTVNEKLSPIHANPDFFVDAVAEAAGSLKGSKAEPPILKAMEKRIETGDPIRYEDLQGDYSALGKELSKGTLPGDVYHAYDQLHEAIGNEMQRIADSQGVGAQLTEARNYWRRMKQAFGKPYNATDAASGVLKSASPDLAEREAQSNRIRLLGSFDPQIPKILDDLDAAYSKARALPTPKSEETGKVNAQDVRAAKGEALMKRADAIRNRGGTWANTFVVLDAIRNGISGNLEGIGKDVLVRGIFGAGKQGIASLLERPDVVKFLTEPTERDIAQIPPELRGDMPEILKAAKAHGVKVSPALAVAVGLGAPKTVEGQKTKYLRFLKESGQYIDSIVQ